MTEPFPPFNTSADPLLSDANASASARRRRKSSALGSGTHIHAGDTGAPALATSKASLDANDVPAAMGPGSSSHHRHGRSSAGLKRLSKRRRARGLLSAARHTMVKHTWVLPACIILLFLIGYVVDPSDENPICHFLFLSYPLPPADGLSASPDEPIQYGKGLWDIAFVAFYTVVLTFTREFIMQEVLRPLARRSGLPKGKQARLMEQLYTAIYFGILGPAGMYVMSRTPVWYFNTVGMYEGYPHRSHEAIVKFYYLFQGAYWAQQAIVLVLGMEKPRKDFKELICHHIVSLALIGLSYRFHFTYIGIAVYLTHDISDFFLATSKTLSYLDSPIVGPYFFLFMVIWIYMRHYINLKIIWSLFTDYRTVGPFELNWETEQYKSWISQYITLALLSSLQTLNLIWLFFICRIAYRFIRDSNAEDDRSEDEEEEEEEEEAGEKSNMIDADSKTEKLNGAVPTTNGAAKQ
jgi:acyl-CoA-dependent ceramide synthase